MQLEANILSDITVFMKYAKYNEKLQRRENWKELVDRNKEMFVAATEDIVTSVGNTTFENPLGFAAGLMLQNNPNEFMVYPIASNDQAGYLEAQFSPDIS